MLRLLSSIFLAAACSTPGGPVELEIENQSGIVLYRLEHADDGYSGFLSVEGITIENPVGYPLCGEELHGDPVLPRVVPIAPGEIVTYSWDGTGYVLRDSCGDGPDLDCRCWDHVIAAAGSYVVHACAGESEGTFTTSIPGPPLHCVSIPFELSAEPIVVRGAIQ